MHTDEEPYTQHTYNKRTDPYTNTHTRAVMHTHMHKNSLTHTYSHKCVYTHHNYAKYGHTYNQRVVITQRTTYPKDVAIGLQIM